MNSLYLKNLLYLFFCLSCLSATAQNFNFQWANAMGAGTNLGPNDAGNAIAVDASGNVYTTGVFYGTVDFDPGLGVSTLTASGTSYSDAFISKFDASGNFVWAKKIGGTSNDGGTAIKIDLNGNILIGGYYVNTVDFDPNAGVFNLYQDASSAFILKLDPSGNFIWAKSFGSPYPSSYTNANARIKGIDLDANNNIYSIGTFDGLIDFDPGVSSYSITSGTADPLNNTFVSKLDQNGDFLWVRNFGITNTSSSCDGQAIKVDNSGNIYSTGYFTGTVDANTDAGTQNMISAGSYDIFVLKLSQAGTFVWAKRIGGTSMDIGYALTSDTLDNVFITGRFYGTVDFDSGSGTSNLISTGSNGDAYVLKLNSSGAYLWAKAFNGSSTQSGKGIELDGSGNVYTVGIFDGTLDCNPGTGVSTITAPGGNDEIFIVKLDSLGLYVAHAQLGGSSVDYPTAITLDAFNNVYTTGGFGSSSADFDPGPGVYNLIGHYANYDVFVSKLSQCTPGAAPTITASGSVSFCNGGSVALTSTSGNSYLWSNGATTSSISVSASGNYAVQTIDASGCQSLSSMVTTITVNPIPTVTANSGTICSGSSFVINPTGASTYTITGGLFNVSPTATMSYSVTGTSAQGCVSSNTAVSTVSVNALPTITVNSGTICAGNSFSIMPTGATGYTITGGSFNVSPTTTTNYSITGTSAQGCVSSNSVISTVSVNVLPTISVNSGTICSGNSFVINPTGANTYTITGGSFNVSPTATTNYSITGTSAQGCVSSNTAVSAVSVNTLPTITVNSGTICAGNSFSIMPTGASTYTITGGSFNVSPTTTTNYSITGTSAQGCVGSNTVISIVTVNSTISPGISISTPSTSVCSNSAAFTSTIVNGGSTPSYQWKKNGINVGSGLATYSPTGLLNGDVISCMLTSNASCASPLSVSSNSITLTVNAPPVISVNSGTICSGSSFVINPTGATTYTITGGSFNVSPTATTNYSITGTSSQGCVSSNTVISTVSVNVLPTISVSSGAICAGNSFSIMPTGASTYTITGGSFNVSPSATTNYSITGTSAQGCVSSNTAVSTVSVNALPTITVNSGTICSGNSFSITPTGANTYTITGGSFNVSPTTTTNYSITGTSAQGCVSSNAVVSTVSVNVLPTISVNSGTICSGNSFVINPTGATTYTITGGSFNVSPTATTNYSITGTSVQGCVSSNTAVSAVSVNTLPTITVNSGAICAGNSFSIMPTGASTYTITGGSFNVSPSATTNYSITGTSAQGCVSSNTAISIVSVNSTVTPGISISTPSTSVCSNSATFTSTIVNGGNIPSYQWKKNGINVGSGLATYSPTGLLNGDVISCILISNASCASPVSVTSNSITLTVNVPPVITVNSGAVCSGKTFTINPTGANTYTITGGSFNVSPTTTTSYSVTGISAQGCMSSNAVVSTVSVNALPSISVNSGAICSGTSFSVTPLGANTYTITGGSFNVSPIATTSYSVTGTSAEGCVSSNVSVSTVSVNALPLINALASKSIICVGESVTLTANGGVSYAWNTGATSASIAVAPSATTDYTVTGTGSNGCSNTAIITQSVSLCTGIESLNSTKAFIEVYPNPTSGIITLKLSSDAQVIITNELGQQLFNQSLAHNEHSIDLSHVATGMYIVTVVCKDHRQFFKLVKQ